MVNYQILDDESLDANLYAKIILRIPELVSGSLYYNDNLKKSMY